MTRASGCSIAIVLTTVLFLLPAPLPAQTPPQTPQAAPSFMAAPQNSQAAQHNFPPLLLQQLSAIKAAALNDDYAYRQLTHLTENIGPRPTGSPQARAAAQHVAPEPRNLGLEVVPQQVTVPHCARRP